MRGHFIKVLKGTAGICALLGLCMPAFADDAAIARRLNQMQKILERQQGQIEAQRKEISDLNRALKPVSAPLPPAPPPVVETRLKQQDQKIETLVAKFAAQSDAQRLAIQDMPKTTVANGRLMVTSSDGRFSASLRMTMQYDMAYFMQAATARNLAAANGPDLSSGANFRRAQIGLQGTVFGDWSYAAIMDFGGAGFETPGSIRRMIVDYNGLPDWTFRLGASSPPAGLADATAGGDMLFLERGAAADVQRAMAGGVRETASIIYAGNDFYGALSVSGGKVQEAGPFDEQLAVVGRIGYTLFTDKDTRFVLSSAVTDIVRGPDQTAAANSPRLVTFASSPELAVDTQAIKLVSAGALNVDNAWAINLESGITWRSFYAQGGYFKFGVKDRASSNEYDFGGYYLEASYLLTGERHGWNPGNAVFTGPRPGHNFGEGGFGAFEIAARYSNMDFNDHPGVAGSAMPVDGLRGGTQNIATLGVNWYVNPVVKFTLQGQDITVHRLGMLGTPAIADTEVGQHFQAIALRSQVTF